MESKVDRQIGKNLKRLRRESGFALVDVARALGVSYQQVQKYETGRNRISAAKLYLLKGLYDVPYGAFFEGIPYVKTM
ncbi:MAG: helix-turn-helix transcriptional regulator [Rhodospirillales bacterium]|nr:helix-turn-helix transcriptional regulator [Rhodospirillales bacterium]